MEEFGSKGMMLSKDLLAFASYIRTVDILRRSLCIVM